PGGRGRRRGLPPGGGVRGLPPAHRRHQGGGAHLEAPDVHRGRQRMGGGLLTPDPATVSRRKAGPHRLAAMLRRAMTLIVSAVLLVGFTLAALAVPVPYVVASPGLALNTLGELD